MLIPNSERWGEPKLKIMRPSEWWKQMPLETEDMFSDSLGIPTAEQRERERAQSASSKDGPGPPIAPAEPPRASPSAGP